MILKKKYQLILLSLIWFCVGIFLLRKGIYFSFSETIKSSFLHQALKTVLADSLQIGFLLILTGLFLGHLKAKKVFAKIVERTLKNLEAHKDPAPFSTTFNKRFFLLIGLMMLLGIALSALGCPTDIRALINVAVGSALIRASFMLYRRPIEIRV